MALQTGQLFINPAALYWSLFICSSVTAGCYACSPIHLHKDCNSNSEAAVEMKTPKDNPETKTHSCIPVLPLQLKEWIHQVGHNGEEKIRQQKEKEKRGKLL